MASGIASAPSGMTETVTPDKATCRGSALRFCEDVAASYCAVDRQRHCFDWCKQRAWRHRRRSLPSLAEMGKYATVVMDPPWSSNGYPTGYLDRARRTKALFDLDQLIREI